MVTHKFLPELAGVAREFGACLYLLYAILVFFMQNDSTPRPASLKIFDLLPNKRVLRVITIDAVVLRVSQKFEQH
jgi:hypothetical protein